MGDLFRLYEGVITLKRTCKATRTARIPGRLPLLLGAAALLFQARGYRVVAAQTLSVSL